MSDLRLLSPKEERIWLLDQLQTGTSTQQLALMVELEGPLDEAALRHALDLIVTRHEALRTSFDGSAGGPRAAVVASPPVQLTTEEFSPLRVEELAVEPFELSAPPLIRAVLFTTAVAKEHVLLLVAHEIACDRRSLALLTRELSAAYEAFAAGLNAQLLKPASYSRIAEAQARRRLSGAHEAACRYWRDRLERMPAALDLLTDRPRLAIQSQAANRVRTPLPEADRGEALAALATLLYRYTGQAALTIGVESPGSDARAHIAGPLTEALPLALDLTGDPSFAELVAQVERSLADAEARPVPFAVLVDELNPERDLARSPIFQIHVGFDGGFPIELRAGSLTFRAEELEPATGELDLAVRVTSAGDGLEALLDYSPDLFDGGTIERLAQHLSILLGAGLAEPGSSISDLAVLSDAERRQLLEEWNETEAAYPDRCLHELIAGQAAATPEAVAVEGVDFAFTYRELDERSNRLARYLQEQGVRREVPVGLYTERTAQMLVGILGILKAGGAYVPLDPTHPVERLGFMLEDAGVAVLVTQQSLLEELPPTSVPIICLDRDWPEISCKSAAPAELEHSSDQLAYIIYTSGSTGRPKGVEIEHRSVVCFLSSMLERPGIQPSDVVLNLTTPVFDPSVMDFFWPLLAGARVVILPREDTLDGRRLAERISSSCATFAWATPTTWRMLLDAGWEGSERLRIGVAGEHLPRALADALLERGCELWHFYGPTEATVYSSVLQLEPGNDPPRIGGAIHNERFYVVDSRLQPVPIGVPGQLLIGGDGVGRGYRNRPELTAEKFIPDPFRPGPDGRLYVTGDVVRYRADRTLDFLGRLDGQVKVRGFRVELGEIESVLAEHPGVGTAVVVLREDVPGDKRLVAYVVPSGEAVCEAGPLRQRCAEQLPAYMVPAAFVLLDSLPTSPNRKVDRNALPPPDSTRPDFLQPRLEPVSPLECLIAETWQQVLHVDGVGLDDDFFELGGDSILATRVVTRLTHALGVEIPLRSMFDRPTVRATAEVGLQLMTESLDEGEPADSLLRPLEVEAR